MLGERPGFVRGVGPGPGQESSLKQLSKLKQAGEFHFLNRGICDIIT